MINARIKQLDTGVRIFLSDYLTEDYLTEDCTLSVVGASADFADVLKTAVTNISTTATATPVKPNPLEERFIGRLLLFKPAGTCLSLVQP
ncbi:hypothetical protein [Alteromonas macleodii]|jgi:hypothetical protein|uniref:hypothetical protein n=1 Tax=Alteromonas macleodii TaxID=28108 RepID=UPI00010CBF6A